jgi:hypothetical protein
LNEPGQSEKEDTHSEEEEPTPRPKRTTSKTQVVNDGISELTSTDDTEWGMRLVGDNDEDEDDGLDNTDLGTIEEDDTLCADDRDSDPQESPLQKKNRLSKQKNAGKAKKKEKVNLRAAISQRRSRKQPVVL